MPKLVFYKHFTYKEFIYYDYACFISILDVHDNEQKFDKSIDNFLQVKMWDIEEDLFKNENLIYEKPNDSELKKIVDFINKHKDKSVFMVHCSAGISRSGAVATFLYDKYFSEIDKEQFRRNNKHIRPNLYILNRLKSLDNVLFLDKPDSYGIEKAIIKPWYYPLNTTQNGKQSGYEIEIIFKNGDRFYDTSDSVLGCKQHFAFKVRSGSVWKNII